MDWSELTGVRRAAFDTLPQSERERLKVTRAERVARRRARKLAEAKTTRLIVSMAYSGATLDEIAYAIGKSGSMARRQAAQHGVFVSRSTDTVRFAIPMTVVARASLRQLAADVGVTDLEALAGLVAHFLDRHGLAARKALGLIR